MRTTTVAAGAAAGLLARAALRRSRLRHHAALRGRTVLVTGGSRGLGLALAREMGRRGARLVLCARDPDELERAGQELAAAGVEVLTRVCDVTDPEQVGALVAAARNRFGDIDVLVCNAGTIIVGPVESQSVANFRTAMDVMYYGALYPTLAVLPSMRRRGEGRIVHISSLGGRVAVPHLVPYSAAKFALTGLSHGLRAELSGTGIRVTTVSPGVLRTGSHVQALFTGERAGEFRWFGLGATMPVLAMDADRAARAIADATELGTAELVLTPQARVLATLHGVTPALVGRALGLLGRVLPHGDPGATEPLPGRAVHGEGHVEDAVAMLGRSRVGRYHQT